MDVVITEARDVGAEIKLFVLARTDDNPFPSYEPGAHIDVVTPAGPVRQYSLCGDPDDRATLSILVKKHEASRGGSKSMHAVTRGQTLQIGAPRNAFALAEDPEPPLLLSVGVGVTPIVSMAHRLVALGRAFTWHHFARASGIEALSDALSLRKFDGSLTIGSDPGRDEIANVIKRELMRNTSYRFLYVCGPDGFMSAAADLAALMLPHAEVRAEAFSPSASAQEARPFSVRLAKSNNTLQVSQEETLLRVLRHNGLAVPSGCEQGICGLCVTEVLAGTVLHRDSVLSDEERDHQHLMCSCVSRADGCLTLNL